MVIEMGRLIDGFRDFWRSGYRWPVLVVVVLVFVIGLLLGGGSGAPAGIHEGETPAVKKVAQTWTCSMHPQIQQPKAGKCPLCFMDLVPVESGSQVETGPRQLTLSPAAVELAGIRTVPVERRFVDSEIRMVGKVEYDESRLGRITARVPGRIDRLFVDYTGIHVRTGDHLVSLYSPQLISAQQELVQALKAGKTFAPGNTMANAAREKLKLWGLTPAQIKSVEKQGKPMEHLTIYSPMAGVVVHKNAVEGTYVQTGTPIYTIADLSRVWVKLDAYESDISWIRYGQEVRFETEAYPGEIFIGRVAFIDPVLDEKTRTVKVRVNAANHDLMLKPGMFVRAVVHAKLSASGKVMAPDLAGKWISPMHPEVIKDKPGKCDVCGMPLVKAESLGYVPADAAEQEPPLVIPASAPLITGARAVVYTAVPGKKGAFEGKVIVLGPRAGDFYLVKAGLEQGEEVVANGAFKIDSDLQIQAKPSMMSIEQPAAQPKAAQAAKIPTSFRASVDAVARGYFKIQHALSSDSLEDAKKSSGFLLKKLAAVDMKQLTGKAHMDWMKLEKQIKDAAGKLAKTSDIEAARVQLERLTEPVATMLKIFATPDEGVYRFHCPMAFDNKGAYWLQDHQDTRNPYFGASMLLCKDSVEPLIKKEQK
jgi:Cu(I)/Ag(I) efflux system membrane fusion protein